MTEHHSRVHPLVPLRVVRSKAGLNHCNIGVINEAELHLHAAHFGVAGESFGTPAVPARGVDAVQGVASGRRCGHRWAGVNALFCAGLGAGVGGRWGRPTSPICFNLLARVVGMLGPCLTRDARANERGTPAIVCNMLRMQLIAAGLGIPLNSLFYWHDRILCSIG